MEYLSPERVEFTYRLPLAEVVIDFFDAAEEPHPGLRQPGLRHRRLPARRAVRVDIMLSSETVDASAPSC